jgi:hypothetical protein
MIGDEFMPNFKFLRFAPGVVPFGVVGMAAEKGREWQFSRALTHWNF